MLSSLGPNYLIIKEFCIINSIRTMNNENLALDCIIIYQMKIIN